MSLAATASNPAAPVPAATARAVVSSSDRLSFALFVALALHALLIFGVNFTAGLNNRPPPTLEITLANHNSVKAPDEADYLAQFNQQASGTGEQAQEMTTDQLAPIDAPNIQAVNPTPQVKAADPALDRTPTPVTTRTESRQQQPVPTDQADTQAQEKQVGKDAVDTPLSAEIASLRAKLDRQRQAIAKRPRIRTLTSVATRSSADAEYLHKWTRKVEFVGNRNFPDEAVRRGVTGQLRLVTVLRPNGTIHSVEILESSGHSLLDNAALQIVHMAAPFPPFPPEVRQNTDQLEIIRTWQFELTGLSTQ